MRESKRLAAILATVGLLGWATVALDARTKKGDQLYAQGHLAEERKDYDEALKSYEGALAQDPAEILYQMASRRVRFQSAQVHVDKAAQLRGEGKLQEALAEYKTAYGIDPSSPIAQQELSRTLEMIEFDRKRTTPAPARGARLDPRRTGTAGYGCEAGVGDVHTHPEDHLARSALLPGQ